MHRPIFAAAFVLLLSTTSCTAPVGSQLEVPPDAAQSCTDHCAQVGMRLSAIAIMASNVGCVCQPHAAPSAPTGPAAPTAPTAPTAPAPAEHGAVTAAMATIAMQQTERQLQQHQ